LIRRTFGCCLGLLLAAVLLAAAVASAPFIFTQAPAAISAVRREVTVLEADLKGKPTPLAPSLWPSPAPVGPSPRATATPTPAGGSTWAQPSSANCSWGEFTLAQDAQDDLAGVGLYPSLSAWYHQTAGWWETAQNDLMGLCGHGPEPTAAECEADMAHFQTAQATHENAASSTIVPDNTLTDQQWNATWIASYTRLESIWSSTGCAQRAGN